MKKKLIIVGIIIILLFIGLSGCNEKSNNENSNLLPADEYRLIGTWTNSDTYEGSTRTTSYIFISDKTFRVIASYEGEDFSLTGTWNITNNKLVMTSVEGDIVTVDYTFSNSDKTLTITDKSGNIVYFTKE